MRAALGERQGGFTLVEALMVIILTALLIGGGWSVFAVFRRSGARAGELAEGLETIRTVAWILEEELSGGKRDRDWWAEEGNTVALRAYRGLAVVRGVDGDSGLTVCYRGVRSPNPDKDSVLFLDADGAWRPHALASRIRGDPGCLGGGEGWQEVWTVNPEPGLPVLGRVFEVGSYHLTQQALRYRRGDGGRQPLTPLRIGEAILEEDGTHGGGLRWELLLSKAGNGIDSLSWSGRIR